MWPTTEPESRTIGECVSNRDQNRLLRLVGTVFRMTESDRNTLEAIVARLDAIDKKLDRLWLGIDFLRTHQGTYLGDGIALTHLIDETPIIVNSNDFGGPMNYISGGRYEQDNLDVLLSFVRPDTVFLDIGANLGFFTLQIARRIARKGRVFAFEPHPMLFDLLNRNVFLNGFSHVVTAHNFGVSDRAAPVEFHYPTGHLGGGYVATHQSDANHTIISSEVKRLDDVLGSMAAVDLVKINVEGHELQVLRGMERIVRESPRIKILLEKLGRNAGSEDGMKEFFDRMGMKLYSVESGAVLREVGSLQAMRDWSGYLLAARANQIDEMNRARFDIYPAQLNLKDWAALTPDGIARLEARRGEILFYGPYWFLGRGVWRVSVRGQISGQIELTIAERFGYRAHAIRLEAGRVQDTFVCERDLVNFECVARPASERASINFTGIEFLRVG